MGGCDPPPPRWNHASNRRPDIANRRTTTLLPQNTPVSTGPPHRLGPARAHRRTLLRALAIAFFLAALLPHATLGAQEKPTPDVRNPIPVDHRVAVDIFSCSGQRPALPNSVVDGAPDFYSTRSCQESSGVSVHLLAGGIESVRSTRPGVVPVFEYVPSGELTVWHDRPVRYESLGICYVNSILSEPTTSTGDIEWLAFYGASFVYTIPSSPTNLRVELGCNWFNFPSRTISADEASVELNPPYGETDGASDDPARAYATATVSDYYTSDTAGDVIASVNQGNDDQDGDELPDSVEAQFGTDPASADTDGDGRSDWEEIQVYGTDPLTADGEALVAFDQDYAYATIPESDETTDGLGAYGAAFASEYYPNDAAAVYIDAATESTDYWLDPASALPEGTVDAQANPGASVSVRVHSCPDDLDASGFYQYSLQCTSERGLYGVPLGLSTPRLPTSFLYSQPDGTGQAVPMLWSNLTGGSITVSEVVSDRPRESVVFCSDRPAGNHPGTLDGTEIPVVDGKMTLPIAGGVQVICEWYRFPGGVATEPDQAEGGTTPSTDGARISIQKWICALGADADPEEADGTPASDAASPNPEGDLASLQASCSPARTGFTFQLTGDEREHPERQIGGQEADYLGWVGLNPGSYTIQEDLAASAAEPTVFCESTIPGRQTVRRNLNQLPATGGAVTYDLTENETLTCEWFNFLDEDADTAKGDGTTDTSITIYAWNCPPGSDPLAAAGNGECNQPLTGLTFVVDGPDAYHSQSNTGDSIPGAVFFGGIAPGTYTVTAPSGNGYDPAVVCNGELFAAPAGVLTYELANGETLACDWFTTSGESTDSDTGEGEVIDVGTNDQDDDGLIDTDETNFYGTDPLNADSDSDGVGDGDEVTYFLDPLNPDIDADGLLDGDELYSYGTDPLNPDTDDDTATDGREVDSGTDPLNNDDYPDA